METLTLIGSLLLVGTALLLILVPLWQQSRARTSHNDDLAVSLADAETRYQNALLGIKELMFDYEMGKVSATDYEPLLAKAKLEAAHIRRQIDLLGTQQSELDPELDAEIERIVAELRQTPAEDDDLRAEVAQELDQLTHLSKAPVNEQCSNCGKAISPQDTFCSSCGQAIAEVEADRPEPENQCPQCDYVTQPDDAFCAQCGLALKEVSREPL